MQISPVRGILLQTDPMQRDMYRLLCTDVSLLDGEKHSFRKSSRDTRT